MGQWTLVFFWVALVIYSETQLGVAVCILIMILIIALGMIRTYQNDMTQRNIFVPLCN